MDYKAPLLKALEAVDHAATQVCKIFDRNVNNVQASLGWEQEYFVVNRVLYDGRPDLTLTGKLFLDIILSGVNNWMIIILERYLLGFMIS